MFFEHCDVKHIAYFPSSRKFLVLENPREILHVLLSGKEEITVNKIFNFNSTKKLR